MGSRPGDKVISSAQLYRRWVGRPGLIAKIVRRCVRLRHKRLSRLTGTDIRLGVTIGTGLQLPHPNGVVIHEDARIGDDCMIMQQVTIGMIRGPVPVIGSKVYIGAGAKVLGGVTIGDGAAIGANAVVLSDVPTGHVAVGVPAVVKARKTAQT